jgi:hypothetical protein
MGRPVAEQRHMAVGSIGTARAMRSDSLVFEGFRLMRERIWVYLAFAAIAAAAAWHALPTVDIYDDLVAAKDGHPFGLIGRAPVSVVLILAICAVLFVVPSALRRIQPAFKMTLLRTAIAIGTLVCVGIVVDAGYALAVIPGIVAGVLLSQALVGALLRAPERTTLRGLGGTIADAFRGSFEMTRGHFATTLIVIAASLAIFVIPGTCVLFVLWVLGAQTPASLLLTSPLLLLTFVYCECVRYSLIVRWYRRLAEDPSPASP